MDGIEPFHRAGIRWLIAVPLMTYRVHGILGAASRYRNRLDKHTPDLIMVTGRLIATALVKTNLARTRPASSAEPQGNGKKYSAESLEETRNRIREVQSRLAAAKAASSQDYAGHGDNQALAAVPHDDPAVDEKLDIVKSPVFPVSGIETPLDVEKLLRDIATGGRNSPIPVEPSAGTRYCRSALGYLAGSGTHRAGDPSGSGTSPAERDARCCTGKHS
jgi:hypothetical protein